MCIDSQVNAESTFIYRRHGRNLPIIMGKAFVAIASILVAVAIITTGTVSYLISKEHHVPEGILPAFSSYEELDEFLGGVPNGARNNNPYMALAGANDEKSQGTNVPHSNTNVRVEGIDEDDIVKTDGDLIYIASYDRVTIVKAYPPEDLRNVSVIAASDVLGHEVANNTVWINGILISEGRLVIIACVDEVIPYDPLNYTGFGIYWRQSVPHTVLSVFNITDPAAPSFMYSHGISGYLLASRMTEGRVYLVSQSYIWMAGNEYALPKIWNGSESLEVQLDTIHYDPESGDAGSFVNILALDLVSERMNSLSIVAGYASTVYMSQDSLFLTFQKWTGGVIVLETGNVSGVATAAASKEDSGISTTIYKISIDGISIEPTARGTVVGWLLDQFSIDESDSFVRIATTTSWTDQKNAVYVLNGNLDVVGSLEGLAPEERIYAARFVGDTLYLVTFRQVDPLFVIDLSVPTNPRVLGMLHIPGFSSYLHSVDGTHILGIGTENTSAKVAVFDVSDPENPVEVSRYVIGNLSWSSAWDYKSILFDREKGLLVIPVSVINDPWYYNWSSDAYVFNVSGETGIVLKGIVGHGDSTWISRSMYIGDYLYTVSESMIKVNSLSDLSEIGQLIYRTWSSEWRTPLGSGSAGAERTISLRI